jgi:hypothetical protein
VALVGRNLKAAPHHHAHQGVFCCRCEIHTGHHLAVTQNGCVRGHPEHFIELVGHVNDSNAFCLEPLNHIHQFFKLNRRQTGCWFIHGDDACFAKQGLGDFDNLPLGDTQGSDLGPDIDGRIKL